VPRSRGATQRAAPAQYGAAGRRGAARHNLEGRSQGMPSRGFRPPRRTGLDCSGRRARGRPDVPRRLEQLPPEQDTPAFLRPQVRPEVQLLAPLRGPPPAWVRQRPAGIRAITRTFKIARHSAKLSDEAGLSQIGGQHAARKQHHPATRSASTSSSPQDPYQAKCVGRSTPFKGRHDDVWDGVGLGSTSRCASDGRAGYLEDLVVPDPRFL
jgi:hypothetical protein